MTAFRSLRRRSISACKAAASCGKVPIHNVDAGFSLADAAWFAEEETLFIFYNVSAEQGLGEPSVIEITYATDDERVDWTPLSDFSRGFCPIRATGGSAAGGVNFLRSRCPVYYLGKTPLACRIHTLAVKASG